MPCGRTTCSSLIVVRGPVPVWVDWPWPVWWLRISAACRQFGERLRQRRALRDLDDLQLADIGISRAEALREAGKPFWR